MSHGFQTIRGGNILEKDSESKIKKSCYRPRKKSKIQEKRKKARFLPKKKDSRKKRKHASKKV